MNMVKNKEILDFLRELKHFILSKNSLDCFTRILKNAIPCDAARFSFV